MSNVRQSDQEGKLYNCTIITKIYKNKRTKRESSLRPYIYMILPHIPSCHRFHFNNITLSEDHPILHRQSSISARRLFFMLLLHTSLHRKAIIVIIIINLCFFVYHVVIIDMHFFGI